MKTANDLFSPPGTAEFSDCGAYRYALGRSFRAGSGLCNFIMLNPSTATAEEDDPTIRRCIDFAQRWGLAGLVVTNLFALRSTDPRHLYEAPDPVGPDNDRAVREAAQRSEVVVCAWGVHGALLGRSGDVRVALLAAGVQPSCLRLTKAGHPSHPLYLPAFLRPQPWLAPIEPFPLDLARPGR